MKLNLVYKFSLSAVFLVLISAGSVGWLFYDKTTELLVEQSAENIAGEIRNIGNVLQTHINGQRADTLFMAGSPPIQGIFRALAADNYDTVGKSSYKQWTERLTSIFMTMIASKRDYNMIRFIDINGQERVVVKRNGEKIISLEEGEFQNKSQREYFKKTLELSAGLVYLSEINLNREHGKISVPHLEVLRSSTPVFNEKTNKLAGIVIITTHVGKELRDLQRLILKSGSHVYITNDRGGYLLHPDKNKAYGFDLGKRYRIQEDFPLLAPLFLPENHDSQLILLPKDTGDKEVVNFTKIEFDQSHPERFIAVGVSESYDDIVSSESAVLNEVISFAVVFVSMAILFAVFLSYRTSRPIKQITQVMDDYTHQRPTTAIMPIEQSDEVGVLARRFETLIGQVNEAHNNLAEMNRNLENRVAERTEALEVSEIFQRSIIENMVDGLITIDDEGIVTSYNPAAGRVFGYERDEVMGENIKKLMPDPYQSDHDLYLANYKRTGVKGILDGGEREVKGLHKSGRIFPLALTVSEIEVAGGKIFSAVCRDITERKQMDKMKTEFVSTVSHELRTPLTAIRGSLGLITGGAVGEVPKKVSDLLALASNNTERLLLLINDILDMQKIESGEMDFNFTEMKVIPFIKRALEENKAYGDQYDVKFILKNELDVQLDADEHRMMQVMANLLSNAAKFSRKDGIVEVDVSESKAGYVRISVTDFGEGIPKEFQPKLFDKFTQSDSSSTRQKGGTGLGLSISKEIVEHHRGRIDFTSCEGEGSSFFIDIPIFKIVESA